MHDRHQQRAPRPSDPVTINTLQETRRGRAARRTTSRPTARPADTGASSPDAIDDPAACDDPTALAGTTPIESLQPLI